MSLATNADSSARAEDILTQVACTGNFIPVLPPSPSTVSIQLPGSVRLENIGLTVAKSELEGADQFWQRGF